MQVAINSNNLKIPKIVCRKNPPPLPKKKKKPKPKPKTTTKNNRDDVNDDVHVSTLFADLRYIIKTH